MGLDQDRLCNDYFFMGIKIAYFLNIGYQVEEYLHDRINMTEWIWPKFGEHDQKIDNDEQMFVEEKP